jgi:ATP-dependent helicase/nuclease subunit B
MVGDTHLGYSTERMNAAVEILWANAGSDIATKVERAIRVLQGTDPLREVMLVTPPGATAGTLRRRLPHCGDGRGVASIRFTTAVDYALELSPLEVRSQRPVTPQLLGAAVRQQLNDYCPPELAPVKDHRSTLDALVQAAERLRNVSLAPDQAGIVDELAGTNRTRRAIAAVAQRSRAVVADAGFRDEAKLLGAATQALLTERMTLPPIVIVLSECFHPGQLPFLAALTRTAPRTIIVALVPEADDGALRGQIEQIAQTGELDEVVPTTPIPAPHRVISCPDQDEEIRQVVRMVTAAITGPSPIPAHRIAVLHPSVSGYARSLAEEFDRANVAWTGPAPGQLSASIAGQATRFLLDCFTNCDRVNVFRLLDVAPLWPTERAHKRAISQWQATCRDIGLVSEADWATAQERLARFQQAKRKRFGESDDTDRRDQATQKRLEQLLDLVTVIQRERGAINRAKNWATAAKRFAVLLERHIGTEQWRQTHWSSESSDMRSWQLRAAAQVTQLISGLSTLDDPSFPVTYQRGDFAAIVEGLLDRPLGREGDPTAGVRVLNVIHGVCLDADMVFIVGVNDGILPGVPSEDLLIRRDLSEQCARWIESADWSTQRARRAWVSVLRGPSQVTATFARSDLRRGGDLYRSEWLSDVPELSVHRHTSHADGLTSATHLNSAEMVLAEQLPTTQFTAVTRRAYALRSRMQPEPTEFDGDVGNDAVLDPTAAVQSISRFETLATCGLSYFLRYVLGVNEVTDAAEITSIEAMDKGNLVHGVLETLVQEWLARDLVERPDWLEPAHLAECKRRAEFLIDERAVPLRDENRLGHETSWQIERAMLLRAIKQTLDMERADSVEPLAAEHAFGPNEPNRAYSFTTDAGVVSFQGKIDRIERIAGRLSVSDFKTTTAADPRQSAPRSTNPTLDGTKLQLPLYAAVAARDFGESHDDPADRHARYVYLRRSDSISHDLPDEAHEQFDIDLNGLAVRMAQGDFRPNVPHSKWGCAACSPDGLGLETVALRAGWWAPTMDDNE